MSRHASAPTLFICAFGVHATGVEGVATCFRKLQKTEPTCNRFGPPRGADSDKMNESRVGRGTGGASALATREAATRIC